MLFFRESSVGLCYVRGVGHSGVNEHVTLASTSDHSLSGEALSA